MTSCTCGDVIWKRLFHNLKKQTSTITPAHKMADEYCILGEDVKKFVRQRSISGSSSKSSKGSSQTQNNTQQPLIKRVPLALTLSHWDSIDHTCKPVIGSDGPISLLETTYNCKMDVDTGQRSDGMKSSQSNQSNDRLADGQPNGDVNFDQLCNVKNLKEEELLPRIKEIVMALKALEDYDRGEGMKLVKSIGDTYWSHKSVRHKIGHVLKEQDFAEIAMKMLTSLNKKGIFKNDGIWFPTYYTLNTLWNYSDASLELAKTIAQHGGVKYFTVNCKHKPYVDNMSSKNVFYVVKSSMSILHNIARNSNVHHYFKENATSDVMIQFLQSKEEHEMLKIMAMLTLAHIVEEEENDKLIDDTGAVEGIVSYIKLALNNERGRYKGFTPIELMDGLDKLAVNDKNKSKIIDAGALPLLLKMLKQENIEEQAVASKALWTLSFDKDVVQKIRDFEDVMPTLEKLSGSQDKNVEKNCKGALFVLKGENDVKNRPKSSSRRSKRHIFISYAWNEKDMVYKLKDRLKQEGLEVWIDVERMGGSTLSAMAEAVENASVVLVCMSEKYKLSPNCRLEAEYTFQCRKDYVPLMLQKQYRPDGWLGVILGAKLYFDFSGKYPFEKPWNGLMKELKGMGKLGESMEKRADSTDALIASSSSTTTTYAAPSSSRLLKMNNDDVSEWLCSVKLDGCVPYFAQFNGKLLDQLKKMRDEAPEFYYQCLERSLKMNLVEILTFTDALQQL
ncbi:unnamed protein product [Mytilus coruscus]|uniref:TIR domain-containing protein n=1 Tax=Mytilus coruscus TaxID=42192 RepID=A0A6J8DYE9_MYTCO|nr:unnamed protein product [Mytilus coruscus]